MAWETRCSKALRGLKRTSIHLLGQGGEHLPGLASVSDVVTDGSADAPLAEEGSVDRLV